MQSVWGIDFQAADVYEHGQSQAPGTQTANITSNSKTGLWSYQFEDGHVIGSNSAPDSGAMLNISGFSAKCVGVPGATTLE